MLTVLRFLSRSKVGYAISCGHGQEESLGRVAWPHHLACNMSATCRDRAGAGIRWPGLPSRLGERHCYVSLTLRGSDCSS